jgi:hypothetical protein
LRCIRMQQPKFLLPKHVWWLVRSLLLGRGLCSVWKAAGGSLSRGGERERDRERQRERGLLHENA